MVCNYAENQKGGSYGGKCPYYKHFQSLVYKTLGVSVSRTHKANKDTYPPATLKDIEMLEVYLAEQIISLVEFGIPYQNIYGTCKKKMKIWKDEGQESRD